MNRLLTDIDPLGCATLTLNNPEQHNAFDDRMIAELTTALLKLKDNPQIRVIQLAANGRSFSAGADLNWMRRMADYSQQENFQDALALAELMRTLNEMPLPTIALVEGAAFGGGVGLIAACDIAIASERASFCLSEVRLGLIPAVISPYILMAIGPRQARRYMLTAERFSAAEAFRIGLVHQLCPETELAETATRLRHQLLQNGPQALSEAKRLIREVAGRSVDNELMQMTAERIATIRASAEGREGLSAFLTKQQPSWFKE